MKISAASVQLRARIFEAPADTLRSALPFLKRAGVQLAFFAGSFLLTRVELSGGPCLLGLALVVGSSGRYAVCSLLGFMLSAWTGPGLVLQAAYIAAAGVCATVRCVLKAPGRARRDSYVPSLVAAALCVAVTEFSVLAFTSSLTLSAAALALCRLFIIAAFSFFYRVATRSLRGGFFSELGAVQRACCAVAFGTIIASMCPVGIGPLSLGHIAAAFTCSALFFFLTAPTAVPMAAAAAGAVALAEPEFAFASVGLLVAGVSCSFIRERGRAFSCAVFCGVGALFATCAGGYSFAVTYLTELLIGSFLFLVVPIKYKALENSGAKLHRSAALAVESKLVSIASAMGDITAVLERVSPQKPRNENMDKLYNAAADSVCKHCALMSYCWVKCYGDSIAAFGSLSPKLYERGEVTNEEVFDAFRSRCISSDALCAEVNRRYAEFLEHKLTDRSARLFRGLLKRQFSAISKMLFCAASELRSMYEWDESDSARIYSCAERLHVPVDSACCIYDSSHHPTVTVKLRRDADETALRRFSAALSSIVGAKLSAPVVRRAGGLILLYYSEQPKYIIRTAVSQRPAGEGPCGDVYTVFADTKGVVHMVLSDGMGTGAPAARDGAVCCAFMRKLMENGFPALRAAELANSTLAMKSDGESACTLDSLSFDMYTGGASFFKAGAAPTFVLRKGEVTQLNHPTLPVGILSEVTGKEFSMTLCDGDVAVMVSDGVLLTGDRDIRDTLLRMSDAPAEEICREIKRTAEAAAPKPDDITVMVARISSAYR